MPVRIRERAGRHSAYGAAQLLEPRNRNESDNALRFGSGSLCHAIAGAHASGRLSVGSLVQ